VPKRRAYLVTALTVVLAAGCSSSGTPPAPADTTPATAGPGGGPVTTSWSLPADASAAVRAAGLPMLGEEKLAVHYHAHLDIIVNGQQIPVPAGIGIDEARQLISPLHVHDTSGVVHIESATDVPFTLGQLFTEWGQPLRANQIGPVTVAPGQVLRVFRNGQRVSGDPAALVLHAHDEIAVWVGPTEQPPRVPTTYDFSAGL
jgi:hypothetical protein